MWLKSLTSQNGVGVWCLGAALASALLPNPVEADQSEAVAVLSNELRIADDLIFPAGCEDFVYNPDDAPEKHGLNVGWTVDHRTEIYQPVVLGTDVTVCGIDVAGWYSQGTPETFEIGIYADDGFGNPDLGNRLTFGELKLGVPNITNWKGVDVATVCLTGGDTYYIGTLTERTHRSALYYDCPKGLPAFSVRDGDFIGGKRGRPTIAMRLRGTPGCVPSDCLKMSVSDLFSGGRTYWHVDGASPGAEIAVVYGYLEGSSTLNGYAKYCADFGIEGLKQQRVICKKNADAGGTVSCTKVIPRGIRGLRILTQAAEAGTCPDFCMSNLDDQIVQ